jgi:hypothetical protein
MCFKRSIPFWVAVIIWMPSAVSIMSQALAADSPATQPDMSAFPPQVKFTGDGDHRNMMEQLGIKALRPGADPNKQGTFDEATANKYPLPELMTMKDGTKVTTPQQWPARRA